METKSPKNSIERCATNIIRLFIPYEERILQRRVAQKVRRKTGLNDPATITCDLIAPSLKVCILISSDIPKVGQYVYYRDIPLRVFHVATYRDLLQLHRFLQRQVEGGEEVNIPKDLEQQILHRGAHKPSKARKTYLMHYKKSRKTLRRRQLKASDMGREEARVGLERLFRKGMVDARYYEERMKKLSVPTKKV